MLNSRDGSLQTTLHWGLSLNLPKPGLELLFTKPPDLGCRGNLCWEAQFPVLKSSQLELMCVKIIVQVILVSKSVIKETLLFVLES